MFKNYLKIAFRNMLKMKYFSSINIFGLSLGMAFCLIMLMYVVNELSYENFHQKKDRIYRVGMEWGKEGKRTKFAGIFPGVGQALSEQFPEVEKSVRLESDEGSSITVNNVEYKEENLFYAEPSLFEVFSYNIIEGKKDNLLTEPYSAVLTASIAKKYFGNEFASGKTFLLDKHLIKVTGVIQDIPLNTHLKTEILVSYSTLRALGQETDQPWNSWGSTFTYFLLREGQSTETITSKLSALLTENGGDFMGKSTQFVLQKLSDIHFISDFRPDFGPKGNMLYIYIFLSASVLILILGCFNYINLTITMYMNRMAEVGVRKVFGAQKYQLMVQFLIDSLLITFISLVFGILLFEISYGKIFNYLGTKVVLSISHLKYFFAIVAGIILVVGIISGGYPALFLTKYKPIDILRKNLENFSTRFHFRKIIVIMQSAITIILIVGTIVIFQQLNFLKNSDLGFEKDNVAVINFSNFKEAEKYYSTLFTELKKYSGIMAVSGSFMVPGSSGSASMSVVKKGSSNEDMVQLTNIAADYDYVNSLGLKIVQGRDFSRFYPSDANESVLINESAIKELKLSNPIGEQLLIPSGPITNQALKTVSIVGIVKDFHMKSKHQKIAPMIFYINPSYANLIVRMSPNNISGTLKYIQDTWKKIIPESPININFLDAMVDKMYRAEEKIGSFISGFAIFAIIISCLGLLGLTSFIINRKIKEVGIRKVLGAEVGGLIFHLSKQFMAWVLMANIIAWPVSYYLINKWLQDFAYKIDISIWVFVLSAVLTLIISFLTIMFRIVRTAKANPVEALKYE